MRKICKKFPSRPIGAAHDMFRWLQEDHASPGSSPGSSPEAKGRSAVPSRRGSASLPVVYSMEQVAAHCTEEDCWLVVDGQVLDVTPFLAQHPGGSSLLLKYAGGDATTAFRAQRKHKRAYTVMKTYQVGCIIPAGGGRKGSTKGSTK